MPATERPVRLRVLAAPGHEAPGRRLAERLNLPFGPGPAEHALLLGEDGLSAAQASEPRELGEAPFEALARGSVRVEFERARPGSEPIVRAVRVRTDGEAPLHVADATGGWGGDAGALWRAGFRVTMIERDPVVAELLDDGLRRLRASDPDGATRIELRRGDARERLLEVRSDAARRPEVVYLDPMYPRTRGGAKRRAAAWLRGWLGDAASADEAGMAELLQVARSVARRRVVVKRPLRGPALAPGGSGSIRGTTTRFDLYPPMLGA